MKTGYEVLLRLSEKKESRLWMSDEEVKVNGIVKCETCLKLWNRDVNDSRNIYKIAFNKLRDLERPPYLSGSN